MEEFKALFQRIRKNEDETLKPYYFDVADDSRVCYVEKDFLSKVICKKLHDEVHCLHYNVSK